MRTLISLFLICWTCSAVELLIEARNRNLGTNEISGRAARGMVIVAKPDGWTWGSKERSISYCAIIKIPNITAAQVAKYVQSHFDGETLVRYRLWRIRWEDLPLAARNKLATTGTLTIKATDTYTGTYDYTWAQVKGYFRNLSTNTDETSDL